jgi:hypothetical protein
MSKTSKNHKNSGTTNSKIIKNKVIAFVLVVHRNERYDNEMTRRIFEIG